MCQNFQAVLKLQENCEWINFWLVETILPQAGSAGARIFTCSLKTLEMKIKRVILLFSSSKACLWQKSSIKEENPAPPTENPYQPKIVNKFSSKSSSKRLSKKNSKNNGSQNSNGIKTETLISDEPSSMCRNSGGWGQPCSYDMAVGHECKLKTCFVKSSILTRTRPLSRKLRISADSSLIRQKRHLFYIK